MANYRHVHVRPKARSAFHFSGVSPDKSNIPIHAWLGAGALLVVLLALIAYRDMLKPGLQAASSLHPFTPAASSTNSGSSRPLRRARSAASSSHSSRASSSIPTSRLTNPKYKGLRNTGNTCFFNSTLQSISSLTLYRKYLYALVQEAERYDIPTPVLDALFELVEQLAKPGDRNAAINPVQLVRALQNLPSSSIRSLVGAHQQQDAHELFALLNEAVDAEANNIRSERSHALETEQAGLRALMASSLPWGGRGIYVNPAQLQNKLALNRNPSPIHSISVAHGAEVPAQSDASGEMAGNSPMISPFDALLAQRTMCLDCGYCEAIRHFSASEISLSVPAPNMRTRTSDLTGTSACSLNECLEMWSDLEQVDWICWNCTLRNTLLGVKNDIAAKGCTPAATKPNGSAKGEANGSANNIMLTPSKKKRLAQLRSKETKLARIIESGLSEDELKQASDDAASPWHDVLNKLEFKKTLSRLSTKQIMISRPPRILAIHLNRSSYSASSWTPAKNNRHVLFPEYLDVSDVTLQGSISLDGRRAMNFSAAAAAAAAAAADDEDEDDDSDADGFRQRQQNGVNGVVESIYRLAAIVVHYGSHSFGHYVAFKRVSGALTQANDDVLGNDHDHDDGGGSDEWLRISDESVTRTTIQQVKQENPYMLFYQLVSHPHQHKMDKGMVKLPQSVEDFATLQEAIAGSMAVDGIMDDGRRQNSHADFVKSSRISSPWPCFSRLRPRTVHRWNTPPLA